MRVNLQSDHPAHHQWPQAISDAGYHLIPSIPSLEEESSGPCIAVVALRSAGDAVSECRELRSRLPETIRILVITPISTRQQVRELLDAGADDFLPPDATGADLIARLEVMFHALQRAQEMDERLARSHRLETVNSLTGELAHDFNNLLAAIVGNTELAMLDLSPHSPVQYSLEQIDKATHRAAELAREIQVLSGLRSSSVRRQNLTEIVQDIPELLRLCLSRNCRLEQQLASGLPPILGDSSRLQQVVLNLVSNASEANGEQGGVVTLRTREVVREPGEPLNGFVWGTPPSGRYVALEVEDNGPGIDPNRQQQIFDPFFSTKDPARGLGLAAVVAIVRAHHGAIRITSGKGACFQVLFPVAPPEKDHEIPAHRPVPVATDSGTLLLIDDEEAVREAARRLLQRSGFTVLSAASGEEGLDLFRQHRHAVSAVILDLNLPGMDGGSVFRVIRDESPDTRVVIWSGYDEGELGRRLARLGPVTFLEKPTQLKELALALHRILEPQPNAHSS